MERYRIHPDAADAHQLVRLVKAMIERIVKENPHLEPALYSDTWGYERSWMVGKVRDTNERGLEVRTWTQKYLTSMSLINRPIQGQVCQKNGLLSAVGDAEWTTLNRSMVASLPFILPWQKQQATAFHRNLQARGSTLDALCDELQGLTGDQAYQVLAKMSEVKGYSKCLAFFVREALCLDIVPIDRHVKRILKRFGLSHVPPPQLTHLIREAGFEPRFVARVLYEQGLQKKDKTPLPRVVVPPPVRPADKQPVNPARKENPPSGFDPNDCHFAFTRGGRPKRVLWGDEDTPVTPASVRARVVAYLCGRGPVQVSVMKSDLGLLSGNPIGYLLQELIVEGVVKRDGDGQYGWEPLKP
jgi:hypothetical protein